MGTRQDRESGQARPPAGPSVTRNLAFAGVAVLAVTAVVALALIGVSSHPKRPNPRPNPNPTPTPSTAKAPQSVTYLNTMVPITFNGMARSYLLSRPAPEEPRSKKKLPIIVVLHGRDASPAQELRRTNFNSVVSPSILVYPSGVQGSWNAGNCCGAAQSDNLDDVGFVSAVLKAVKATQRDASQGRAFLAGYSNGGKMALTVACRDSGDFLGVAVYGATDAVACPFRAPSDVLEMAGTTDPELSAGPTPPPPELTGFVPPSFDAEVQSYRVADGCGANPVVTTVGQVTLTSWVHCTDNARVGQAVFTRSDHGWPPGSTTSPSAEGVAWAWFSSLGA